MARRKLTPKQIAAGFGGKRAQAAQKGTRARPTSRRRTTTTKPRAAPRRRTATMRYGTLNKKALLNGAIAGAVAPFASKVAGQYGPALALGAVGFIQKDAALQTLAGVSLGAAITSSMPGSGLGPSGVL